MHFNKKSDVTNVVLRISDSLAFPAVARHVYGVVDDAENERKLLVKGKNNLAPSSRRLSPIGSALPMLAMMLGQESKSGHRISSGTLNRFT